MGSGSWPPSVNWDHGRAFADLVRMPDRLYDQDIVAWPDHLSVAHWREEIAACQAEAAQRFAPSMR